MYPGSYVVTSDGDTGVGMSNDVLERAFEPFFTTKPQGQGTGLGLSQVYGFVRQPGGLVRIDSTPGHGTNVRLMLPLHTREVDAGNSSDRAERLRQPGEADPAGRWWSMVR